jgi:nucleoside-diphosphate-sugar epimerase
MVNKQQCYAVTGAAGFVGRQLVSHLLDAGHRVVAITRNEKSHESLESLGAKVRIADVRIPEQLDEAFQGVDGVFHVAALFNHPERTWDDYRDVNVTGTVNVLRAAQTAGARKVVHCSTIGVATEAKPPPYDEETPYSPQPDDKYEVSKTEGEQAARAFAKENDLRLTVIRPAQVYGPGDHSKAKFYKLVKKGVIVSPGHTQKHLIYVDDLCDAFLKSMTSAVADGEVFVIAGREPTRLTRLIEIAASAMEVPTFSLERSRATHQSPQESLASKARSPCRTACATRCAGSASNSLSSTRGNQAALIARRH